MSSDERTEQAIRPPQDPAPDPTDGARAPAAAGSEDPDALVLEDLLLEDISIDGMCGVY